MSTSVQALTLALLLSRQDEGIFAFNHHNLELINLLLVPLSFLTHPIAEILFLLSRYLVVCILTSGDLSWCLGLCSVPWVICYLSVWWVPHVFLCTSYYPATLRHFSWCQSSLLEKIELPVSPFPFHLTPDCLYGMLDGFLLNIYFFLKASKSGTLISYENSLF